MAKNRKTKLLTHGIETFSVPNLWFIVSFYFVLFYFILCFVAKKYV